MTIETIQRARQALSNQLARAGAALHDWRQTLSPQQVRKLRLLGIAAIVPVFGAVAAFGVAPLAPDAALLPVSSVSQLLAEPVLDAQLQAIDGQTQHYLHEEVIRRGDTVATLLDRLEVNDDAAERFILKDPSARSLYQLRPGRLVQAQTDASGALLKLRYLHSPASADNADNAPLTARALEIQRDERDGGQFHAADVVLDNERRLELRSGEIRSSLFGATDAAGIPDGIATQIAEIFSGDIDFYHSLRRGDQFRVVYEMFYQAGEVARPGRVLAVEFVNNGKPFQAVWYEAPGQAGGYYGFDGQSLRRAFLRAPLEFTRISSGFGGRLHPILNTWKQHQGVDFAAPIGTPVRTTGDGNVEFVGKQNGYGNAILIKHNGQYATLYGHLSGFASGLRKGQHVSQGQLIGYVGMTGWATGPHLHYEFRVNNEPRDPLTVALPQTQPIAREQLATFRARSGDMTRQLGLLRALQVAGQPANATGG